VALTNSAQRVNDIPTGLDSVLLEDRTPLVVKGLQIVPSGSNRFKHTDNVILYTEIYEPLLTSATAPVVAWATAFSSDRPTSKYSSRSRSRR